MSEHNRHRRLLYWLVGILFLLAAAIFFVKLRYFDFSLDNRAGFFYRADASVSFDPEPGKEIRISISLPDRRTSGYSVDPISGGEKQFRTELQNGLRRAVLELPPRSGRQTVSYRFRLIPRAPVAEAPAAPPPVDSKLLPNEVAAARKAMLAAIDPENKLAPAALVTALLRALGTASAVERQPFTRQSGVAGTVEAAIAILAERGWPARPLRGIFLNESKVQQQPALFLDVWYDNDWHVFQPNTGKPGLPEHFLVLQRKDSSLFEVSGAKNSSIRFSVTRVPAGAERLNRLRADIIGEHDLGGFTLFSLPASQQNLFKRLALLPLAILLIVVTRNVVGIQTMGTFMPVLIAMAFLEMKLLPGLISFLLILTIGLAIRAWLTRLNLLMVPRISAVVVVVILLMQAISIGANLLELPDFMGVAFFPLIIIAWTIERASTTWEEDGAVTTLKQLAASLATATVSYLVLASGYLQYLLYTFSELNLIILGVILLLGTYTGYRFTELMRFQPLVKQ